MLFLLCVGLYCTPLAQAADPNVLITCHNEGGGVVRVDYEVLVEDGVDPGRMRAIALRIWTSNAALFDAISDYATGSVPADSTQIPTGYSVFMGSIQFAADPNYVSSFGDPVAPSGDPDAGDDLPDAAEIVVELGSLYTGDNAPPASGTLFRLEIDGHDESDTTLTIAVNTTRGGCVMQSDSPANVVSSGCSVEFDPLCWSYPCNPYCDYDGDGFLTFMEDINPCVRAWLDNVYDPCCDYNRDGFHTYVEDWQICIKYWPTGCPVVCPEP